MQIESILRSILVADPDVAEIIGTRAYQMHLPREPTFPAVVYQMISRTQDAQTGIVRARMQYTCMAESWRGAADLADAVRCALHGYRGACRAGASGRRRNRRCPYSIAAFAFAARAARRSRSA